MWRLPGYDQPRQAIAQQCGRRLSPRDDWLDRDGIEVLDKFRAMAKEAGRDPKSLSLRLGGAPDDLDKLRRFRDIGVDAVNVTLMSDKRDEILSILDRWAGHIRQLRG